MSDIAIQVENLSKHYRIGGAREPYGTLRDSIASFARTPLRTLAGNGGRAHKQDFWALQDVSFQIHEGTVLGVIGRNGAGKSTLLKILSRITEPTKGRVELIGRVGSLLEVGTGFHPELTGFENIYLNGAILGMTHKEIDRKLDEIIAFAEIENFLETPVKYYSSGMYMRLAFAVAAHLEPEILLVDEVLAVGDAAFQKKCFGKISMVAKEGRTILFVSHNMNAILRLCSKCILLANGRIAAYGNTADIVSKYLAADELDNLPSTWIDCSSMFHTGTGEVRVEAIRYASDDKTLELRPYPNGPLEFILKVQSDRARAVGSIAITIYDMFGGKLVNADTVALGETVQLDPGSNLIQVRIHALHLNAGRYVVGWWLANPLGEHYDFVESALDLEVIEPRTERNFGIRPKADGIVSCDFQVGRVG